MVGIKKLIIGLVIGLLVGLWFGVNIGKGRPFYANPIEEVADIAKEPGKAMEEEGEKTLRKELDKQ